MALSTNLSSYSFSFAFSFDFDAVSTRQRFHRVLIDHQFRLKGQIELTYFYLAIKEAAKLA